MNAARLCEGFAAAENLAGRMAADAGEWRKSAEHYARAAELAPRFWKPRYNLGLIYLLRQKRVDESVPLLEHAAELAPDVAETHFFLGHAYAARAVESQASGRMEEALADRDRARAAFCRAKERGHPEAAGPCQE
jgi:tetratricopeptide (TPR) repeat protein